MSDSFRTLPSRPSLEAQKKSAKALLRAYRAGDADARARVRRHLPDKARIALGDVQFVLAREYGFESWAKLKAFIEKEAGSGERLIDRFRRLVGSHDTAGLRHLLEGSPGARKLLNEPIFSFDSPALVHVAGSGRLDLVDVLLEFGADPNRRSDWWAGGFHALYHANGAVADRLLEAGAVMDTCAAARQDRPEVLERILASEPARVHERGGDGQTPLHFAHSREVIDLLLARGADIDARDIDHRATAAEWMLERRRGRGRYELAGYLVDRGASADVFLAAALGRTEILRNLLDSDASALDLRTGQGAYGEQPPSSFHIYTWTIGQNLSPLQVAAQFEQEDAVGLLSEFAAPRDRLLAASSLGRVDEAKRLLAAWPELAAVLSDEKSRVLPDAAWSGDATAVEGMLRMGFTPAAVGESGGTVLHCAAWQGWADCVEAVLGHEGARRLIEVRDGVHGSTPLGWCCHGARFCRNPGGDYPAVARLLLDAGAVPGPNLEDAPPDVLEVIETYRGGR